MSNDAITLHSETALPVPEAVPFLPEKWSDWQLQEEIGGRGCVTVFRAVRTDEAGTSNSAIKILRVHKDCNETKHIEEIKTMLSLKSHPNIVSIEDYATVCKGDNEYIFIRMELLTPLDKYVAANDFDEKETIRVGMEICDALEHCQQKKILHMDIKPSNIFVSDEGHFKLGDFGISRSIDSLASEPFIEYTPNFMGPELYHYLNKEGLTGNNPISSKQLGWEYDLYSLGLVMYWIQNKRKVPFLPDRLVTSQERIDAFKKRIEGEPLPPLKNTSSGLNKVISKACSFDPKSRYHSPAEMKKALVKLSPKVEKRSIIIGLTAAVLSAMILSLYFLVQNEAKEKKKTGLSLPADSILEADAYGTCGESLWWIVNGNELRIAGTGGMYDYNSSTNKPPWDEYRSSINVIVGEEGITKIGEYAFFEFENLTKVVLPKGLRRINHMAFGYCYNLPSLTLPEGVEHIEDSIIYRCPSLTEINLPSSLKLIEGSFAGECKSLTTISLGENCTAYILQDGALFDSTMEELICHPAGLDDLSYTIPEKVRSIGIYAFAENHNLLEVSIPDGLITIDDCAFTGCRNLKNVYIPDTVGKLGNYAFYGCEKLKSIRLSSHIDWIDQQAFYDCRSLEEIIIPPGVIGIGTFVFSNCPALNKVVIPESVTFISDTTFSNSPNVIIDCERNSFAEQFAIQHGIAYTIAE